MRCGKWLPLQWKTMRRALAAGSLIALLTVAAPARASAPWQRGIGPPVIDGAHLSLGARSPATRWYFAEGHTGPLFDEYVVVSNSASVPASLTVALLGASGAVSIGVPAGARATVNVKDMLREGDAGAVVTSDFPIVAERVQYFDMAGRTGGSSTAGTTETSKLWTFAEGYTGPGFSTFILLANPSQEATTAHVAFQPEGGAAIEVPLLVPGAARVSLNASDYVPGAGFTTRVQAEAGIVAERSMYFAYGAVTGGHVSLGARAPSPRWDFAEGSTAGFDTYYLLANPALVPADIAVQFRTGGGAVRATGVRLSPGARVTIRASDHAPPGEAGATFYSLNGLGFVAERAMYFDHGRWNGGTATLGAAKLSGTWHFAEGYTSPDFESWVLVANPEGAAVAATVSLHAVDGRVTDVPLSLGPRSRGAVRVNDVAGFASAEFAVIVTASGPVVAERASYFRYPAPYLDGPALGSRVLSEGMSGPDVLETQRRMIQVGLDPGPLDGYFSWTMTQATYALEKWLGLARYGDVGERERSFLVEGHPPVPRTPSGDHVEIDISRQLALLVRAGSVIGWWPVSTGRADNTPRGAFSIYRKDPGWGCGSLGCLYNGSYFVGGFAIHGYPTVPTYPASAGCVRVPMSMADWVFEALPVGLEVFLYD